MIEITQKTNCCGCQACANICPRNCISMQADEEGFLYPHVDKKVCVDCGLCEKVCPILNKPQTYPVLATYAAKHKSEEIKLKSSSGGMFSALAEVVLKEGGVVFGASFDKDWNVVHAYVDNLKNLDNLRRSKYVQSDIGKTYQQAKQFLEQGRAVLFTGTPCQIAGLRNYLGKEYEHLLTADLFCHGVPSPGVWKKFLTENFDRKDIKAIFFRYKRLGWNKCYLSFQLPDGMHAHSKKRSYFERLYFKFKVPVGRTIFFYNTFFRAFLRELINRPSCHACHFKGYKSADFSMGDLWGEWPEIITKQDKSFGISALTVNTRKAQKVLEHLNASFQTIDFDRVAKCNKPVRISTKPHPKRAEFFIRYQTENFNKLVCQLLETKPVWVTIPRAILGKIVRNFNITKRK